MECYMLVHAWRNLAVSSLSRSASSGPSGATGYNCSGYMTVIVTVVNYEDESVANDPGQWFSK